MNVRRSGSTSIIAGVAAIALLAACSSSSKSAATTTTAKAADTTVATTAAPTTSTSAAPTTSAAPDTSAAPVESAAPTTPASGSTDATTGTTTNPQLIKGLTLTLLTTDELNAINGFDLASVDFDPNKPSTPPCGGTSADKTVPPLAKVGASWQSKSVDVAYNEVIRVYDSTDGASQALTAGLAGFACGKSTDGMFTFSAPKDVTAQVTTSTPSPAGETFKVLEVDVSGTQLEGAVYAVDFSDSLTAIQALRKVGLTDAESGPNPQIVLEKAIDKLFATAAAGRTATTTG